MKVRESLDRDVAPLLELDPDLGVLLDGDRLAAARSDLRVSVRTLHKGIWDTNKFGGASPDHIGLLLLEGVVSREVLVSDIVSTELLGPGDIVRPWRLEAGEPLLSRTIRWTVLSDAKAALLDRRFAAESGRYPEIGAAILDRMNERALRLAVTQAISQLNRVDRRLLAFLWHLSERWGKMTPEGVALPMTLSHRMLGQLVGARRPTVSTALGELARQELIRRRDDGTWLLTGDPIELPPAEGERVIPIRRHMLPDTAAAKSVDRPVVTEAPPARMALLRHELQRVREEFRAKSGTFHESLLLTTRLADDNATLRARCQSTRAHASEGDRRLRVVPS